MLVRPWILSGLWEFPLNQIPDPNRCNSISDPFTRSILNVSDSRFSPGYRPELLLYRGSL